jgi:hypothetical protein
VYTA